LAHDLGVSEEELDALIQDPAGERGRLMALLKNPANMGCGHCARLKRNTSDYPGMSQEIIDGSLEGFFDHKWNGDGNMDYAVLHGAHDEKSVLAVSTDAPLNAQTPVPMIQPSFVRSDGVRTSAYVLHPQFEEWNEGQWIEQALQISGLQDINLQRCRDVMRQNRQAHRARTAQDLVTTQPTYNVKYDPANPHRLWVPEAA
jgi:hypothetical protein